MKINYLILCGPDRSGKTTTLHYLARKIIDVYGTALIESIKVYRAHKETAIFYETFEDVGPTNLHMNCLYVFAFKNGYKIGISTHGDYFSNANRNTVRDQILISKTEGCDIFITAAHLSNNFVYGIKSEFEGRRGVFIPKTINKKDDEQANRGDASFMFDILEECVSSRLR